MHLDAPDMAVADGLLELFHGEVFGIAPGIEVAVAQIDGVGAVLDGSPEGLHGPGGREKFKHGIPRPACRHNP